MLQVFGNLSRIQKDLDDRKAADKKAADDIIKAEYEAKRKIEAEEKNKRLAPDREKLLSLAAEIQGIALPLVNDKEAQTILKEVRERLERPYSTLQSGRRADIRAERKRCAGPSVWRSAPRPKTKCRSRSEGDSCGVRR